MGEGGKRRKGGENKINSVAWNEKGKEQMKWNDLVPSLLNPKKAFPDKLENYLGLQLQLHMEKTPSGCFSIWWQGIKDKNIY